MNSTAGFPPEILVLSPRLHLVNHPADELAAALFEEALRVALCRDQALAGQGELVEDWVQAIAKYGEDPGPLSPDRVERDPSSPG